MIQIEPRRIRRRSITSGVFIDVTFSSLTYDKKKYKYFCSMGHFRVNVLNLIPVAIIIIIFKYSSIYEILTNISRCDTRILNNISQRMTVMWFNGKYKL